MAEKSREPEVAEMGREQGSSLCEIVELLGDRLGDRLSDRLGDRIADSTLLCTKEVLTMDEAARYCGVKKSYLYKLTMQKNGGSDIPHYKAGKMIYFNRKELEGWLQRVRVKSKDEIAYEAERMCRKGGRR